MRAASAILSIALAPLDIDAGTPLYAQTLPPVEAHAQRPTPGSALPFAVGEELVFRATFGKLPAGTARMRVQGVDTIRGRAAYHVVFIVDGGVPFFRVHDRYESWMDTETLSSLRYVQHISEGRYHRETTYEFFPERAEYRKNDEPPQPSVSNPLDEGSFIYAARVAHVGVGDTVRTARYFIPERNPVEFIGERIDTVDVGAGEFATTVVRPRIKTDGLFADGGDAEVWFSNDARRVPVLVKTRFAHFWLTLSLQSLTADDSQLTAQQREIHERIHE
jgi:hypothetical protein